MCAISSNFVLVSVHYLFWTKLVIFKTPRKELTLERGLILHLYTNGQKSYAEIANLMSWAKSTIQTVIGSFKYEGRINNNTRSGQPSALTDRDKRQIKHLVDKDPFSSAVKIATEISNISQKDVHPQTIRRAIKSYDFKSYTPRKNPYVSLVNRKKRLEFAKAYAGKPFDFWRKVIFEKHRWKTWYVVGSNNLITSNKITTLSIRQWISVYFSPTIRLIYWRRHHRVPT